MEGESSQQEEREEQAPSPTGLSKRSAPPLKDATKSCRKKSKSENVHLPASDVRSNYHRIFETIFNGCQKAVATKHLKSMCTDDCVMVIRSVNNPFGPNYRELRGIESMVEYVDTALEAIPDCIFAITDSKFFRKPQNESIIISSYTTNGRMIYTIDTLNSEDVEDIDSAISGLQMLYQGSCGAEASAQDETVQLVCQQVESAVSKIEASNPSKTGSAKPTDALYSFVYAGHPVDTLAAAAAVTEKSSGSNTTAVSPASIARSSLSAIPAAAVVVPPARTVTVEPFDYRAKFSETGASLFEPALPLGEEEEDDLFNLEIKAATAAATAAAAAAASSSSGECGDVRLFSSTAVAYKGAMWLFLFHAHVPSVLF